MDRPLLNNALSSFEDTMTEVVRPAWEIANTPYLNPQARVMALREIREAHKTVFEKLFDAGDRTVLLDMGSFCPMRSSWLRATAFKLHGTTPRFALSYDSE